MKFKSGKKTQPEPESITGDQSDQPPSDFVAPEGTPWRYRNPQAFRRLTVIAGLSVVAGLAVLVVILRPLDTTSETVRKAMVASRKAVLESAVDINSAKKLRQIRAAAVAAERRIPVINDSIATVDGTNDLHYERPAIAVLESEKRYLQALADLQTMGDRKLTMWKSKRRQTTIERKRIGAMRPLIDSLDVAQLAEILPSEPQMEQPLKHLDTTISAAAKVIGPWLRRLYAARVRKEMELASMSQYGDAVRGAGSQYTAMRKETQSWADSVSSDGSTYEDAYIYLYGAREQRIAVRDGLQSAQRPAAVTAEHDALVSIVDGSIGLIEQAGVGLADQQFGAEDDYSNSQGWQNFQSGSGSINSSWPSAMQSWSSALDDAVRRVRARKLPRRPDV